MESKGNASLLKVGKTTEWRMHIGGYIAAAYALLILAGCIVAYFISMMRGNVDAVLPLISDAAGSPPQNGLFGFLVSLGGMFGAAFMLQRYLIVAEKNIVHLSSVVVALNKLSLVSGLVSLLGITLISGYPFNFQRNRDTWFTNVGRPHIIGGLLYFGLGLVYIVLQTILTFFSKKKNDKAVPIRFLLFCACSGIFVFYIITVPEHMGSLSHLYYLNTSTSTVLHPNATFLLPPTLGTDLQLPVFTGGSYWRAAAAEWALVVAFCCYALTFFKEAQEYAIVVQIETRPGEEEEEFNKKLSIKAPPPRKVLRRDSTCQTMPEFFENSTKKRSHEPVTKETMSEVDERLQRILDTKDEKTEAPPPCNGDTNGGVVDRNGKVVGDRNGTAETVVVQNGGDENQTKNNESNCPLAIQ